MGISDKVLRTQLATIGHIKIGGWNYVKKGDQTLRLPAKYDHFKITTMERDARGDLIIDKEIHGNPAIGDKPIRLSVILLYNDMDLTWRTRLARYEGKTKCRCSGDGEVGLEVVDFKTGEVKEVQCPCPHLNDENNPNGTCKPNGRLSCILEACQVAGGVHTFTTTSWNSIKSITASLKFLAGCTGGRIAGIPLEMTLTKKDVVVNGQAGKIWYVNLVYRGAPKQMLLEAMERSRAMIEAGISLKEIEAKERIALTYDPTHSVLSDAEVAEFYPEQAGTEAPPETSGPIDAGKVLGEIPGKEPPIEKPADPPPETKPVDPPPQSEKLPTTKRYWGCPDCGHVGATDPALTPSCCSKCGRRTLVEGTSMDDARAKAQTKQEEQKIFGDENPPGLAAEIRAEFTRLQFTAARQKLHIKVTLKREATIESADQEEQKKLLASLKSMK